MQWRGSLIVGRTSIGRTAVEVLTINHREAVAVHAAFIDEGVFPPTEQAHDQRDAPAF